MATRDDASRFCPSSPMGANRIWREYRSRSDKRFHLPLDGVVNRIHERLCFDRESLSNNRIEFFPVLGQNEEWREARLAQTDVRSHDCNRQIPRIERPHVDDSRQDQGCAFDRMDFLNAFRDKPIEKILQRTIDELRIGTILAAEKRLERLLPQPAAENNRVHLEEAVFGR